MTMNDPNRRDDDRVVVAPAWRRWLPWIIGAIALLIVLSLFRGCGDTDDADVANTDVAGSYDTSTTTTTTTTGAPVVLPGGQQVTGQPGQLNYDLAQYMASTEAQGRRFTFDNLHFDTASANLQAGADDTIKQLAQILAAYPNATVRVEGFTDERGDAAGNKQLSEERAATVAKALIAAGVASARVSSAALGETNSGGQSMANNRRTDLVVLTK
jgi:outer membrane protein OmpA-like peptidoglycan-associated protein